MSTASRVVPGSSLTIARASRTIALMSDDFPAFGFPTMARERGAFSIFVFPISVGDWGRRSSTVSRSAGVPDIERPTAARGSGCETIARDARLIVDDRDVSADEPIKERRFSDVRPPDNGDSPRAFLDRFRVHKRASSLIQFRVRVAFRG